MLNATISDNYLQQSNGTDFYKEELGILRELIREIENGYQLNRLGIEPLFDRILTSDRIYAEVAEKLIKAVQDVYDGLSDNSNQLGVSLKLKEIYKDFSGLEYKV